MSESNEKECLVCKKRLPEGVRFCVACGTHNFDEDASKIAASKLEIRSHKRRKFLEALAYWWRYLSSGIRL